MRSYPGSPRPRVFEIFIVGAERNHLKTKINTTHRGALHVIYFKYEAIYADRFPVVNCFFEISIGPKNELCKKCNPYGLRSHSNSKDVSARDGTHRK
jgi:hypothetical protein